MIGEIVFVFAGICFVIGILEMLGKLRNVALRGIPKATLENLETDRFVRAEGAVTFAAGLPLLATGYFWNAGNVGGARISAICAAAVMVIGLWAVIRMCTKK